MHAVSLCTGDTAIRHMHATLYAHAMPLRMLERYTHAKAFDACDTAKRHIHAMSLMHMRCRYTHVRALDACDTPSRYAFKDCLPNPVVVSSTVRYCSRCDARRSMYRIRIAQSHASNSQNPKRILLSEHKRTQSALLDLTSAVITWVQSASYSPMFNMKTKALVTVFSVGVIWVSDVVVSALSLRVIFKFRQRNVAITSVSRRNHLWRKFFVYRIHKKFQDSSCLTVN